MDFPNSLRCVALFATPLLAAPPLPAAPQSAAAAPDAPVVYRVDLRRPQTQTLEVSVTVPTEGVDVEEFLLPVWRPGRYTVLNPAATVRNVRAISETGAELQVRRSRHSGWSVRTEGAREVSVSYTAYANSLGDRTRHVDPTHAFLSGSTVFLYSPRLRDAPVRVEVDSPADWKIATGLDFAPGRDDVVEAANYDVLVDSPLEIGEHDRIEFEVGGKPHQIVIWPEGVEFDAQRMVEDFSTIIAEQMSIFGALPYERYVFLIHAGRGGGGTEHLNSTIMQTSRASIEGSRENDTSYKRFLSLVAHEFFHTWNVKQFRPAGIHPYDYQNENTTDLLWVCEGTTSYYTSLSLVRAELSKIERYIERLGSSGDSLRKNPGARVQSLADSSWDSWISSFDADSGNRTVSFYGKGSQVSLCLDLELRRRTENAVSLDHVMKALYERFPLAGPGYTSADLIALLDELSDSSFEDFFEAYVFGTEPLPFEAVLPTVGLEFAFHPEEEPEQPPADAEPTPEQEEESEPEPTDAEEVAEAEPPPPPPIPQKATLGLRLSQSGSGSVIRGFRLDGPAYASGLLLGDEILTLNERRLRPGDLEERLAELAPGDVVKLHFLRDDRLRVMEITLGGEPDGAWKVRRVEEPSESQKAAYASWIGHPWPEPKEEEPQGEESDESEDER